MSSGSSSSHNASQGFSLAGTGARKWLEVTTSHSESESDDDGEKRAANLEKKKNSMFEPPIGLSTSVHADSPPHPIPDPRVPNPDAVLGEQLQPESTSIPKIVVTQAAISVDPALVPQLLIAYNNRIVSPEEPAVNCTFGTKIDGRIGFESFNVGPYGVNDFRTLLHREAAISEGLILMRVVDRSAMVCMLT